MGKMYYHLWPALTSFCNLPLAFCKAARGKREKPFALPEVQAGDLPAWQLTRIYILRCKEVMMHRKMTTILVLLVLFAAGVGAAALAAPQAFTLAWWTVDGGGGTSSGGGYTVAGTIGQPDAGGTLSGGNFTLSGGFWGGGELPPLGFSIYLPTVIR